MENLFDYLMKNYGFPGYSTISEVVDYVKTLYPKYPERPSKPQLPTIKSTPAEHREYADSLEKYNELMITYSLDKDEYQEKEREINIELEKFIKELSGMNRQVPEKYHAKLWSKAWEDGHSGGYTEVYQELCELVDIFE